MQNLLIIACISQDRGLGYQGQLLWHIPADVDFFKRTTMGKTVVMGRKTFESIGRPLPGRQNIVLSRRPLNIKGVATFSSQPDLMQYLSQLTEPIYIIGGATLYEMFIDQAQKLFLTEVADNQPADTYFPDFDASLFTKQSLQEGEHDGRKYSIIEYTRKP